MSVIANGSSAPGQRPLALGGILKLGMWNKLPMGLNMSRDSLSHVSSSLIPVLIPSQNRPSASIILHGKPNTVRIPSSGLSRRSPLVSSCQPEAMGTHLSLTIIY